MELLLNAVWAVVAGASLALWLRYGKRGHRSPLLALSMLLVLLFPVISVSDDLWSLQNPAETDTCVRRQGLAAAPHASHPAPDAMPEAAFAGLLMGRPHAALAVAPVARGFRPFAALRIENRPPPAA